MNLADKVVMLTGATDGIGIATARLLAPITAVMIGGDDIPTTEKFGAEIAPAVRELVDHERGPVAT